MRATMAVVVWLTMYSCCERCHADLILISGSQGNGDFEAASSPSYFEFGSVPEWAIWSEQTINSSNTRVEYLPPAGSKVAYLDHGAGIVSWTSYRMSVGDKIRYSYRDVAGARDNPVMYLVYEAVTHPGTLTLPGSAYSLNSSSGFDLLAQAPDYTVLAGGGWVGARLGIGLIGKSTDTGFMPIIDNVQLSITSVPEPSALAMVSLAFGAIACARWRSRTRAYAKALAVR